MLIFASMKKESKLTLLLQAALASLLWIWCAIQIYKQLILPLSIMESGAGHLVTNILCFIILSIARRNIYLKTITHEKN